MVGQFECSNCGKTTNIGEGQQPQCGYCGSHNGIIKGGIREAETKGVEMRFTAVELFLLMTVCAEAEDRHAQQAEHAALKKDRDGAQHQSQLSEQFRRIRFKLHQQISYTAEKQDPGAP